MDKHLRAKRTWILSNTVVVILLLILLSIYYHVGFRYRMDEQQLVTPEKVQAYLKNNWLNKAEHNNTLYVPTGVYIQSLVFNSPNDVALTGYIWQTYPHKIPLDIQPDFVFPEAINLVSTLYKQLAYKQIKNDQVTLGTYFEVLTRQDFDYKNYPFDDKVIWLRIQPKDFDKNIILVPDLKSYDATALGDSFGIDHSIVLEGFKLRETYFAYHLSKFDTNFGLDHFMGKENFPELYFNIVITRNLINALILHVLPLFAVLILLFATLMMVTENKEKIEKYDFSASSSLGACSALFFILILVHNDLRNYLNAGYVVYLEYIYIIAYLMIVLVAVNAYIFASSKKTYYRLIHYADNLIPKVLFWPITLVLILFATMHSLL